MCQGDRDNSILIEVTFKMSNQTQCLRKLWIILESRLFSNKINCFHIFRCIWIWKREDENSAAWRFKNKVLPVISFTSEAGARGFTPSQYVLVAIIVLNSIQAVRRNERLNQCDVVD